MSNAGFSTRTWPKEKGRPTGRPPFLGCAEVRELFASPEVRVRRRRRRRHCWVRRLNIPARCAATSLGQPPGPDLFRPCWLGPARRLSPTGLPVPGCRRRPVLLSVAGGGGVLLRPRALQRPTRRRVRDRVPVTASESTIVDGPAGSLARRGEARSSWSSPSGPHTGPAEAPLLRFMSPSSVRWPCRAVRGCRPPDDPAAALGTVSPRCPLVRFASVVEASRCVRDAWRDGRLAPAVFRLRPPRRPFSPVVTGRAPVRTGHAPPLLHGRCSATRASRRTAWPVHPACAAPAALLGFPPFAALLPPAGVAASPPPGPTCRFPDDCTPTRS
jgi:hypothetical protein